MDLVDQLTHSRRPRLVLSLLAAPGTLLWLPLAVACTYMCRAPAAAALCEAPHLQVRGAPIAVAAADLVGGVAAVSTCVAFSVGSGSEFPTGAPTQVVAGAEGGPVSRSLVHVLATAFVGELLQRITELEDEVGLGTLVPNTRL